MGCQKCQKPPKHPFGAFGTASHRNLAARSACKSVELLLVEAQSTDVFRPLIRRLTTCAKSDDQDRRRGSVPRTGAGELRARVQDVYNPGGVERFSHPHTPPENPAPVQPYKHTWLSAGMGVSKKGRSTRLVRVAFTEARY
jgi:hypothetical protein